MKKVILITFVLSSCAFYKDSVEENVCSESLFKVVKFNSMIQNLEYDSLLLSNLLDTSNFSGDVLFFQDINAKNVYQELNKYNSKKFKWGVNYAELNYNCYVDKDEIVVQFSTEDLLLDSTSVKYVYEYKLVNSGRLRIFSYRENFDSIPY